MLAEMAVVRVTVCSVAVVVRLCNCMCELFYICSSCDTGASNYFIFLQACARAFDEFSFTVIVNCLQWLVARKRRETEEIVKRSQAFL